MARLVNISLIMYVYSASAQGLMIGVLLQCDGSAPSCTQCGRRSWMEKLFVWLIRIILVLFETERDATAARFKVFRTLDCGGK
jgi:hypothetical protein